MHTPSIGTKKLKEELEILYEKNIPLFIHGAPGIGKSYIVNATAEIKNVELRDVRLSQLDAVDLRGVPSIQNSQTVWMPPVFLPEDENSEGILFLDELNSAPPSVQAAIYQLVLDRKIGEYSLPKNWRIICAGNRINDKGVVFRLPAPLSNRMVHLLLDANIDDFKEWGIKNEINPSILGFLSFRPDLLSQEVPKNSETNPAFATPRSWTMLSNIIDNVKDIKNREHTIYGTVGYGGGIEFMSFVEVYKDLPDIDKILRGELDYVPENPATLFACVAAIVSKYDGSEGYGNNIIEYSYKLPVEFGVMLVKDCVTKDEALCEASSFDGWMEKYGEYLI